PNYNYPGMNPVPQQPQQQVTVINGVPYVLTPVQQQVNNPYGSPTTVSTNTVKRGIAHEDFIQPAPINHQPQYNHPYATTSHAGVPVATVGYNNGGNPGF